MKFADSWSIYIYNNALKWLTHYTISLDINFKGGITELFRPSLNFSNLP